MNIELHLIQNFAPSNLNRDDTNNPKDCEFGGVRRARISSQCIKRAIRKEPVFAETTSVPNGSRTRLFNARIKDELVAKGKDPQAAEQVGNAISDLYVKRDKDGTRASVLIYFSREEVRNLVSRLLDTWPVVESEILADKKPTLEQIVKNVIKISKNRTSAPDIALFGRMLAEKPELNLDAACQVAHAISTHAVSMDMDYFTAVDDEQPREETGAGMMGMSGFNSACFYRYACIDFDQLVANLGDPVMALLTVEGFLRAAIKAVPTGKQNSHAAQNPPSFCMAVVRNDGGAWSLANAFDKPVNARGEGIAAASVRALDAYWGKLTGFYGNGVSPVVACLEDESTLTNLRSAQVYSLDEWIQKTLSLLPQE